MKWPWQETKKDEPKHVCDHAIYYSQIANLQNAVDKAIGNLAKSESEKCDLIAKIKKQTEADIYLECAKLMRRIEDGERGDLILGSYKNISALQIQQQQMQQQFSLPYNLTRWL